MLLWSTRNRHRNALCCNSSSLTTINYIKACNAYRIISTFWRRLRSRNSIWWVRHSMIIWMHPPWDIYIRWNMFKGDTMLDKQLSSMNQLIAHITALITQFSHHKNINNEPNQTMWDISMNTKNIFIRLRKTNIGPGLADQRVFNTCWHSSCIHHQ